MKEIFEYLQKVFDTTEHVILLPKLGHYALSFLCNFFKVHRFADGTNLLHFIKSMNKLNM